MAAPPPMPSATGVPAPGGAFPPFQSHTFGGQLLWFAITFGLLYYLMAKVALPRVGAILHERQARLAADLAAAQTMKTESDQAAAAHEKALAEARNNAKAIAQQTRDTLAAEADARRKQIEAELAERLAGSEATLRTRTAEAMGNVREIAGDTAQAIVERLTARVPDRAAIDAALDRLSIR